MREIREALTGVLENPCCESLWALRGHLLEAGLLPGSQLLLLVTSYHSFLDQLSSTLTSRQFSNLASALDIGSIGGIVASELLDAEDESARGRKLLAALFSEGLMVLGTRQHVKAWEADIESVVRSSAWFLYDRLWSFSIEEKPDLPASSRRRLLDRLFAPMTDPVHKAEVRAVGLGRLFQLLLAAELSSRGLLD